MAQDAAEPPSGSGIRRSLGTRLVLATLAFSLVFTLLAVGVRTLWAWRAAVADMTAELTLIEQVSHRTLAKSIWDLDMGSLRAHMESLAQATAVGQIVLTLPSVNAPPEVLQHMSPGWGPSALAPVRELTLTYEPYPGRKEPVGTLRLAGDERVLWAQMRSEVLAILATQIIQSLLLASMVMLMFSRLVTQHVRRIARHLAWLTPATLDKPLTLERRGGRHDELALLVRGVNQLQGNLQDYLRQKTQYEHELASHRDRLSELVQARTAELEAANTQLRVLSQTDALTGLPNRRRFDEVKRNEFARAQRSAAPLALLALLVCDIDHFKRFNDTYGHAAGDECLQAVAQAMHQRVQRSGDTLARIGGEEFCVLLPATDAGHALVLARHLCAAVEALRIPHAASDVADHVTLSVGVAHHAAGMPGDFEALFHRADLALYRAKQAGRNRAACYDDAASDTFREGPLPPC
ncbi:diguanylate cyclase [Ramlibacter sp. H39-3-26]|uniref:GGDEF domain-containing protein n=1 Tax=Curvibacter soli TaxID=3031331 RepID=UPI0023DC4C55|nr:diguanylate cyclase [Ramlibacter sp. H39-3-26]MDF1484584.1 diguanylate cyclase [Ramlibacter sp. H39-3-26]